MHQIRWFIATLLVVLSSPTLAANVLVIASYDANNEWSNECITGIKTKLGNNHRVEIIYLDTKQLPKEQHQAAADKAWQTFVSQKPDIVLLGDDNAVGLLARRVVATNTPLVLYGVNDNPRMYFDNVQLPTGVVGVLERRLFTPLIRLIHQMVPLKHQRILVMFDDSTTTAAYIGNALRGNTTLRLGALQAEVKPIASYQEWQYTIRNAAKQYDAIVMENWYTLRDVASGNVVPEDEVLDWSGRNSTLPIFSTARYAVAPMRAVGAITISGIEHGEMAGQAALDILAQKTTEPLIITESDLYYFNQLALERFGLTLPAETAEIANFN
ncbi:ABC transporter substrate-binding protein [Neiella marina]|uniref:ABC transporter substrate-binding protein n=1 Tax=Neiella marina TaxID=508461 RepID=UPI00118072D0|nr:hypothetical protein [Neiella marina]